MKFFVSSKQVGIHNLNYMCSMSSHLTKLLYKKVNNKIMCLTNTAHDSFTPIKWYNLITYQSKLKITAK